MFRDARTIGNDSRIDTDLCIIGGGAAGITIALGVKEAGFSTTIIEAGGFDRDDETQAVYDGAVDSDVLPSHYLRTSRLRWLGGTTNHWGGHSVVINRNIFEQRAGVPGGEWPFGSEELRPYYPRAAAILRKSGRVRERWAPEPRAGLVPMERYGGTRPPDRRLGAAYRADLQRASLQVLLHASVTALHPSANGQRIRHVTVRTLAGNQFTVGARAFVLATGAIENARLLLLPTEHSQAGIGNERDLVGRFFADHLFRADRILETTSSWSGNGPFFTFDPALQEEHAIPEVGMLRQEPRRAGRSPTDATFAGVAGLVDERPAPVLTAVSYYVEPLPDPDNRVTLSPERDPFGQPRSNLRFVVTAEMRRGFARAVALLARLAGQHGLGRVQYRERDAFGFGSHHMFTTRMSDDPARGVVDADGKVHGMSNLHVAGSSVFPSGGCGNPTFPLIALAARLADHLIEGFARRAFEGRE